jgi:hypothetical protein
LRVTGTVATAKKVFGIAIVKSPDGLLLRQPD